MIDSETGLEIFRDFGEGVEPEWIAFAIGLENADTILRRMAADAPGRYLIWDPVEAEVISTIDSTCWRDA